MVKVSVVVPAYYAGKYLIQAVDSALGQSLQDIEIICVDIGSGDDSLKTIAEYAETDRRIQILTGPNGGYGKAVNMGLDAAQGEYIGILGPFDHMAHSMLKDLYDIAKKENLDFVCSDFYRTVTDVEGKERLEIRQLDGSGKRYQKLLNPSKDSGTVKFRFNIRAGIYKKEFIEKIHIRYHETPGISFQDIGFFWQVSIFAERAMIVNIPYYTYHEDESYSSLISGENVYSMSREYDLVRDILMNEADGWNRFKYVYWWEKCCNYLYIYNRTDSKYKKEYRDRMSREYRHAMEKGELDKNLFSKREWRDILFLIGKREPDLETRMRNSSFFRKLVPYLPHSAIEFGAKLLER